MAMLKKNLMSILFGVACIAALGMAFWGMTAGSEVEAQVKAVDQLGSTLRAAASGAKKPEAIKKTKELSEARNQNVERTLDDALGPQVNNKFEGEKRQLLIPDILPEPKSDAARINFRPKFKKAFDQMIERLHARGRPTPSEITKENERISTGVEDDGGRSYPWRPDSGPSGPVLSGPSVEGDLTRVDVLRENGASRIAERIAKSIYMYVDDHAIGPHEVADTSGLLKTESIWQAHMTLWIAQDFAATLGKLNDDRVKQLESADRAQDAWVANMPVKRWELLSIAGQLGYGGGLNELDSTAQRSAYGTSFTEQKNNNEQFVVPIRLELIVEEASVMRVIDAVCAAGYYTPMRIEYREVPQNPMQENYIYGDDPIVKMVIDVEAYFFRSVYEEWLSKDLKKILATPGAIEDTRKGRG